MQNSPLIQVVLFSFLLAAAAVFLQFYRPMADRAPEDRSQAWMVRLNVEREGEDAPEGSASLPPNLPGPSQLALGRKIDLNRAAVEDLAALPGVGTKMAERIVQDRMENGPFQKLKDLMRVKGVKEKKFIQIESYVTVGP